MTHQLVNFSWTYKSDQSQVIPKDYLSKYAKSHTFLELAIS